MILTLLALASRAAGQDASAPPPPAPPTTTPPAAPQPEPAPTLDAPIADDEGPVVVGKQREKWSTVDLLRLDTAFEFRFQNQTDKISRTGQADQKVTDTRYRETLDLSGEAIIGHKNLLDITGSASIGREDIFLKDTLAGTNDHDDSLLTLWDINALVLGTSRLPTDIFTRQEQNDFNQAFSGNIREQLTEYGIGTRYQDDTFNVVAQARHRDTTLTGNFGNIDSKVTQDTFTLQSGVILSTSQRLDVNYTFDRIDESQKGAAPDSYNRHDANIIHTYTFGEERLPSELRSSLRLYDQDGLREQRQINWDEVLSLRHSERFDTRYSLRVDSLEVRGDQQTIGRADATARYRLFDSLVASGTIGAQQLSAPGGFTSDEKFISGDLTYTKRVPYGTLDAAVGGSYTMQANSERGSTISIIDETYTYRDGFPLIISRRNIVAGSFIVTPLAGFPIYIEGIDYRVSVFPDRAEIRGIVGGALVDGQQIKISYDIGPEPSSDINTLSTSFSIRYSINEGWIRGTSLYSTYRTVSNDISTLDPSLVVLDDTQDLLLGVEYRRNELEARYEYNVHESDISPYTIQRVQALYTLPLDTNSSLIGEWTREWIDFSKANDQVTFDRGSLRLTHRLSQSLDANAVVEYRNEDSSLSGTSTGLEESLGLNWHWRQTTVYASFRNSNLEGPGSTQDSQFFQFGIRRTF